MINERSGIILPGERTVVDFEGQRVPVENGLQLMTFLKRFAPTPYHLFVTTDVASFETINFLLEYKPELFGSDGQIITKINAGRGLRIRGGDNLYWQGAHRMSTSPTRPDRQFFLQTTFEREEFFEKVDMANVDRRRIRFSLIQPITHIESRRERPA